MPYRPFFISSLLVLSLSGACDDDKGRGDKSEEKSADKTNESAKTEDVDPNEPSRDWPAEALTTVEDEVEGVKFSLDLPKDLKKEVKEGGGALPGYVTWNGANAFMDPGFTVQLASSPPTDVDAAARKVEHGTAPREVTLKKELEGGGFVVSAIETSKQFVVVKAWRPAADGKTLRVTLQVRASEAIDNLDALRPWMEKVASSLVAK